MGQAFVGNRMSDDLRMLRDAINTDRAILNLPAPTGLRATSLPAAVLLEWNPLAPSYLKSIDGARIWRAPRALLDDTNWYSNPNKVIICNAIRSTTYTDSVGNTGDEFIYWVQWINLDGKESGASAGTIGFALWDSAAPGLIENLHVLGANGEFSGSWSDPLTNILTLDNFAQQYSTTSGFTTAGGNTCTTWLLGRIYSHRGKEQGKTYWFRYAAHNLSGDTEANADPRLVAILPNGWGPWTHAPENPVSSGWDTGPDTGPPTEITVAASANGLTILFGAQAMDNAFTVEEGHIRIKRVEDPGATVTNLTTPDADIPNIPATTYGCRLTWAAPRPGRYFFSWRLRNSAFGWSDWTGDPTLLNVPNSVQTTNEIDTGPPQDWTVETRPGTDQNSVFVYTSRPKINGANLLWVGYQLKDTSQGAWRAIDENAGAAVTYYDGSAINHKLNDDGTRLVRESGVGFGTAKVDDMLLIDVRGGQFHRNYCQWGLIQGFETGDPATSSYIILAGGYRPQVNSGLRVKVVKPPWTWDTEGYLGALVGNGGAGEFVAGKSDQQFVSAPIPIDGDFNSIDSRVWFENHYSRSDASSPANPPTVSANHVKVIKLKDDVIPGAVVNLSVTGANGEFVAKWEDPLTGSATIDDTAIQYATDPGFSVGGGTSKNWGYVNSLKGRDPGKSYYWRVAVHNQSDKDSHASTAAQLGAKGWGPWTAFGAPTVVNSGGDSAVPTDTVLPGSLNALGMSGGNGVFKAWWQPPTTGNLTIDTYGEQYALDAAFAQPVETIQLGDVLYAQGTAPDKTYYFRFAAHNQSGLQSDSSTYNSLGPTGWGPWTLVPQNPVSSGLVPLDPTQVSENLVYNGGFEIVVGGLPDGWSVYEVSTLGSWSSHSIHKEGNLGVALVTDTVQGFSIMSKSFAVRPGERLYANVWAQSSGSGSLGFYFRMIFHSNDPDFGEPGKPGREDFIDLVSSGTIPYNENFTRYEGRFTVKPGMYWCRVALYNWSGPNSSLASNYHFDDVMVARIISGGEIDDNTIPPSRITGEGRSAFVETFEEGVAWGGIWNTPGGAGSVSIVSGVGVDGSKVARGVGQTGLSPVGIYIPYDPSKLYRMTVREIARAWASAAVSVFYAGLYCYDVNKASVGIVYVAASNYAGFGQPGIGPGSAILHTGFFKGIGASVQPAPDPTAPSGLPTGTAYIAPIVLFHWNAAATSADITDCDDIRIDILEETQYTSPAPNGTFSATGIHPFPGNNDPISWAVSVYFTYTQGLVKADQIALTIGDGNAGWVERFSLPPTAVVTGFIDIHRLNKDRQHTISIVAESFGAAGIVAGTGAATFSITFTPSTVSGSRSGSHLGSLDWAGGNVWFDSYQYRNNIAPSNAVPDTIVLNPYHAGSGASMMYISGLSYNQGPYIATHLAVILKSPAGTPDLYSDMVVARIAFPLPATFRVPIPLMDNETYTVAVAAVAMVKNGAVAHGTFVQRSTVSGLVWIQCGKTPTNGSPQQVKLGNPDAPNDKITFYRPAFFEYPYASGFLCRQGGTYYGGISMGPSTADFYNGPGYGISITQETLPNIIYGNHPGPTAGDQNAHFFPDGNFSAYAMVGGGKLVSYGTGAYWMGSSGVSRNFASAGPHCGRCGYDFWTMAAVSKRFNAALHICGWCGAVYKSGPKSILRFLTKKERSEIIRASNPFPKFLLGIFGENEKEEPGAKNRKPRHSRLRGRNARRRRKPVQDRVRRIRSRSLRNR
jgi:hypothetical protein